MKTKLLFVTASLVALVATAPAFGADLAARRPMYTKAPAMAPVYYDWSGFYVGINGGGGSAHTSWDFVGPGGVLTSDGSHDATGGTLGGQIGYRWQMSNWVFGLEGQGNWADFSGDNISPSAVPALRDRTRMDAFGLFTGQVGYAFNNVLFYAKGGAAVVSDKYDVFNAASGALDASASGTRWGAAVGAGLEFSFAQNWSVGVEYDHLFLGHSDITLTGPAGIQNERIGQDADIGLVRLNYRFGGPVVARY
jgi:outer membrane immunogenic protein